MEEEQQDELHHFMVGWRACFQEMQKRAADRAAVVGAESRAVQPRITPAPSVMQVVERVYGAPDAPYETNWMHVAIGGIAAVGITALIVSLIAAFSRK